jgi:glycosyltransferase involved in cell wall biosynthesis
VRILILSWRCPRNPKAGGAEVLTYEIARRLVAHGNQVEWFAAAFPGAPPEEDLDGVHLFRAGRQWTVHLAAYRRYRGKLIGRFDVVLDQVNTIPFFTPLWAGIPAFMFIHQLAREVWWYESPFPINAVGYLSEPWYLRIYRRTPVLTISPSTEWDLRQLGFSGPISIIPKGLERFVAPQVRRESSPTFLYVGRLSPSKRVADVVRAFSLFRRQSFGKLWIAGDGLPAYIRYLYRLIHRNGVSSDVEFFGRVSNEDKYRLMARAHALLLASTREGWGLVVIEANACGTPAVVYNVAGLRDAVCNERTGLVVDPSPSALAKGMIRLSSDLDLYRRLADEALQSSRQFSYDDSARVIHDEITRAIL